MGDAMNKLQKLYDSGIRLRLELDSNVRVIRWLVDGDDEERRGEEKTVEAAMDAIWSAALLLSPKFRVECGTELRVTVVRDGLAYPDAECFKKNQND